MIQILYLCILLYFELEAIIFLSPKVHWITPRYPLYINLYSLFSLLSSIKFRCLLPYISKVCQCLYQKWTEMICNPEPRLPRVPNTYTCINTM